MSISFLVWGTTCTLVLRWQKDAGTGKSCWCVYLHRGILDPERLNVEGLVLLLVKHDWQACKLVQPVDGCLRGPLPLCWASMRLSISRAPLVEHAQLITPVSIFRP